MASPPPVARIIAYAQVKTLEIFGSAMLLNMAATESQMLALGTKAPGFTLPDPDGRQHSLDGSEDVDAYLVMFICNHCPYVRHLARELARIGHDYRPQNVAIYAINSNDYEKYPADAYQAACTPDMYVFNSERKLVYRGQLDDSRPANNVPVSGNDLRAALDAVLSGTAVPEDQTPSIGCNIKWKPGNEPA
jgi:thiol-disulfide isomerase/thioredoxin